MLTVPEIKEYLNELLSKLSIDVPESLKKDYFQGNDYAHPYVVIEKGAYHLKVRERGYVFEDWSTKDIDELMYKIVEGVTSDLAYEYALHNHIEGQDSRRLWFETHLKYIREFGNEKWTNKVKADIEEILRQTPYDE